MNRVEHGFKAEKSFYPSPVARPDTPKQRTYEALVSLTQTLRRLSHRAKREAQEWREADNQNNAVSMELEADRLWRDAMWNLRRARSWRPEE